MSEELSEFYIEKAKNELGETEIRKEQSIRQFKEWLSKHPFIKYPEIDDFEILKFIRPLKYQMQKSFEAFEKTMIHIKQLKFYLETPNEIMPRILSLYESEGMIISNKRDHDGSKLLYVKGKIFDNMEITTEEIIRLSHIAFISLYFEEETQISGIKFIVNCRGLSFKTFSRLPFKLLLKCSQNMKVAPMRLKGFYFIGLPKFISTYVNFFFSLTSKKMQKRIQFISEDNKMLKYFDKNILIEEYGGTLDKKQCIEDHREIFLKTIDHLNSYNDRYDIDFKKFQKFKNETNNFINTDFD